MKYDEDEWRVECFPWQVYSCIHPCLLWFLVGGKIETSGDYKGWGVEVE